MTQPGDDWTSCPPGQFERLAGRLRQRRNRRVWLRSSAVATASVALAAAAVLWNLSTGEPHYGGITCSEVIEAAEDFRAKRLSAGARTAIVKHLEQCAHCRDRYEQMNISVRPAELGRQWAMLRRARAVFGGGGTSAALGVIGEL